MVGSESMGAGDDDFYSMVELNNHKQIKLFVYNSESDGCREVSGRGMVPLLIDPSPPLPSPPLPPPLPSPPLLPQVLLTPNSEWGGEGSLGCGIGYGYLHRIPEREVKTAADPEMGGAGDVPDGGKGVEPNTAPPTGEGYDDVSLPMMSY